MDLEKPAVIRRPIDRHQRLNACDDDSFHIVGILHFLYTVRKVSGGMGMPSMKEIWAEAKNDMKKNNDKFADDMRKNTERTKAQSREISESGKARREQINNENANGTNRIGIKSMLALWGAIATIPLFLFGLFLLFVAGVIIWSIF